jgi:hypothetical protein
MPPMEAIVANTSRNAWLMGLEGEVGVIAPGKLADIVIWNSDPLADITVLQRPSEISTIIKDGRVIDPAAGGFRQLPDEPPRAHASIEGSPAWQFGCWLARGTDGSNPASSSGESGANLIFGLSHWHRPRAANGNRQRRLRPAKPQA